MKMLLIYPVWPSLERQTPFHLPPHGPVVFAAALPEWVEVHFVDEHVQEIDFEESTDLVAISTMLTCQLSRAFAIADRFRSQGTPVIFGGIATMLHSEDVQQHADSVFLGEAEGHIEQVLRDFATGQLKPVYNVMKTPPDTRLIGPARRDILKHELYTYRGVQMLDLVHASRGCKFDCFPCCSAFLGGKQFRPRPIDHVIAEMAQIQNNRLFIVDNSLAQDRDWVVDLFKEMKPLKKKWVSHPIFYDGEVLKHAAEAGCWYVYQAFFDTSEVVRNRIRLLKDHGIGIEGTIILGTDDQDVDFIKRLVDFLCENELDLAEFTIMTPFPHSPIREKLEKEGRILSNDWINYSADKVVFQPKQMTPDELIRMYHYAWDTFYSESGQQLKFGELLRRVIQREMEDNTYRRYNPRAKRVLNRSSH